MASWFIECPQLTKEEIIAICNGIAKKSLQMLDDKILFDACSLFSKVFATEDEYILKEVASNMVISLIANQLKT